MSSIDPAVASVIAAKQSAVQSQIATALAEKSLSATKQRGEAIVQWIKDAFWRAPPTRRTQSHYPILIQLAHSRWCNGIDGAHRFDPLIARTMFARAVDVVVSSLALRLRGVSS